jgi:hypothetical protein
MAILVKHYLDNPTKNKVLASGTEAELIRILDKYEAQLVIKQTQPSQHFIEFNRTQENLLRTVIYKNVDTDDEETININYSVL